MGVWKEVGTKIDFVEVEMTEQHVESRKTSGDRDIEDATVAEMEAIREYLNKKGALLQEC